MFTTATWLILAVLLLVAAIIGAFFAFGRGLVSLYKQAATRRYLKQAKKTLSEGKLTEALTQYLKAESHWAFNCHDGRRPSLVKDISSYTSISSAIFQIVGKPSASVRSDVNGILAEMKSFLGDHPYFSTDPRKTRSELLERWGVMCHRLESIRGSVRSTANPKF